jgi:hypothetical protein
MEMHENPIHSVRIAKGRREHQQLQRLVEPGFHLLSPHGMNAASMVRPGRGGKLFRRTGGSLRLPRSGPPPRIKDAYLSLPQGCSRMWSRRTPGGGDMKARIAACILIGLTQQCLSDETLFTCRGGTGHSYVAEGGVSTPGWSAEEWERVTRLILKQPASGGLFDIQWTSTRGRNSFLEDACSIERKLDQHLELAFVVTCKDMISTYVFYTRNGVDQLLETHLVLFPNNTGASVSMTKECKPGN